MNESFDQLAMQSYICQPTKTLAELLVEQSHNAVVRVRAFPVLYFCSLILNQTCIQKSLPQVTDEETTRGISFYLIIHLLNAFIIIIVTCIATFKREKKSYSFCFVEPINVHLKNTLKENNFQ